MPGPVDTGDSFAYVKFVSDGSGSAAGFSLSFEASIEGRWTLLNHNKQHPSRNRLLPENHLLPKCNPG